MPGAVRWASWLTYAGVAFGIIASAADLVVSRVFRMDLLAAERAADAEELRHTGEPVGESLVSTADFSTGWAIASLVLAVGVGIIAVALARSLRQAGNAARVSLAVVSGLVVGYAVCPCGPPLLALTDSPNQLLGGGILLLWVAERLAIAGFGVAVLILTLIPSTARYCRVA
jgi:hypothetical protein